MKVVFHRSFRKRLEKLSSKIKESFSLRFQLFLENPRNPILNVHELRGGRIGQYSFNVTGDYRVVFSYDEDVVTFREIGTHSELYNK